ncbi:MAG: hypothetical protein ACRCY3_03095 [Sphingorhabdus sp.]
MTIEKMARQIEAALAVLNPAVKAGETGSCLNNDLANSDMPVPQLSNRCREHSSDEPQQAEAAGD